MPRRNKPKPHVPFTRSGGHANKRRFTSKQEAIRAIMTSNQLDPDLSLRAYQCLDCQGWHLTSAGQNDIVKQRKD